MDVKKYVLYVLVLFPVCLTTVNIQSLQLFSNKRKKTIAEISNGFKELDQQFTNLGFLFDKNKQNEATSRLLKIKSSYASLIRELKSRAIDQGKKKQDLMCLNHLNAIGDQIFYILSELRGLVLGANLILDPSKKVGSLTSNSIKQANEDRLFAIYETSEVMTEALMDLRARIAICDEKVLKSIYNNATPAFLAWRRLLNDLASNLQNFVVNARLSIEDYIKIK